jgi:hypothetical protein
MQVAAVVELEIFLRQELQVVEVVLVDSMVQQRQTEQIILAAVAVAAAVVPFFSLEVMAVKEL